MLAGRRRLQVMLNCRYVGTEMVSTISWTGLDIVPNIGERFGMPPRWSDFVRVGSKRKASTPSMFMLCPHCRARFNYGSEGIREVQYSYNPRP